MPNASPSLDTVFTEAVGIPDAADRAAYLDRACGPDDSLRRRAGALVAAHFDAGGDFLEAPAGGATAAYVPAGPAAPGPDAHGTMVGPYRLLEKVGEGGMGTVYVAEQVEPVKRRVALKVIKAGMDTREVVARFEQERQALALMDHPHIAKVLDAGATAEGRPYFVMELVRGLPVTDYCDRARLPAAGRLRLFAKVCRAVQHAHQKGVIHRDIKPSNVLVTLHDGDPVPKVIDFGVAKAVNQSLTDKTVYTRLAQMVGTPLYMAPEQAELSGLDVDTRADVYGLGVLLYELLTGATPFDPDAFRRAGFDEVRRIIREDEPPRPSARVSTLDAAARSTVSALRGLDDRQLSRLLRGDLDWVVMKALEKDRGRRYESAGAFAADVDRFLADEPVVARPPTAAYRARKFARRNRAAVLAGAAMAALLALGAAGTAVGLVRALEAEGAASRAADAETASRRDAEGQRDKAVAETRRADDEAATAKAVNAFIRAVFAEASPEKNARGRKVSVEEVLGRAAARVPAEFAGRPLVEAAVRATIGETYLQLGAYDAAAVHLERALDIRRRELGNEHADTLEARGNVALLYHERGQFDRAEPLLVKTLEACRRVLGPDHAHTLTNMNNLALTYQNRGRRAQAEPLLVAALAGQRRRVGEKHPDTLTATYSLAGLYLQQGRDKDAEPLLVAGLDVARRELGADSHVTMALTSGLAHLYDARRDPAKAGPLHREALAACRRVMGEEHPQTLAAMTNVALIQIDREEYTEAEALMVKAVDAGRRVLGDGHPDTLPLIKALAMAYSAQHKYAQAAPLVARVLDARRSEGKERPARHTLWDKAEGYAETFAFEGIFDICLTEMNDQAVAHRDAGRPDLALPLLEEAHRLGKARGPENPDALLVMSNLALVYQSLGKLPEALTLSEETLALQTKKLGADHVDAMATMNTLAVSYWGIKRLDKSIPLFEEGVRRREAKLGRAHADTLASIANLGINYKDAGRLAEAVPLLEEGYRASKRHTHLRWVGGKLFDTYVGTGRAADAITLARELATEARAAENDALRAGLLAPLGLGLLQVRAFAEAEPLLRECLAAREKAQPDLWTTFNTQSMLGGAIMGQGRHADAEPLLVRGYDGMKERETGIPPAARVRLPEAAGRLAQMYEATGRPEKAKEWRARARPAAGAK